MGAPATEAPATFGGHVVPLVPASGDAARSETPHGDQVAQAKQDYELVQDLDRLQWWVDAAHAKGQCRD